MGCTILDPWEGPFHTAIGEASTIRDWPSRVRAFKDIGVRTDFRYCGEFDGQPFNLQVLYWIKTSGRKLFRRIEDLFL